MKNDMEIAAMTVFSISTGLRKVLLDILKCFYQRYIFCI